MWSRSSSGRLQLVAGFQLEAARARDGDSPVGLTGMMVTVRVADSGLCGAVPKAKPLLARRRRRKFWGLSAILLIFEWFLSG